MTGQFDSLGDRYEEFSGTPFREFLEVPSVMRAVGDVKGLSVFDYGCGAGDYTRWLAEGGASRVVGFDVSQQMVDHARQREQRAPLGIEYCAGTIPGGFEGVFDLVLSVYVIPYAVTRDDLSGQFEAAARLLRPGGRYVALPVHPEFPYADPEFYDRYGLRVYTSMTPEDGDPVTLELVFGQRRDVLTARYWSRETLSGALHGAGFRDLRCHDHHVTDAGLRVYGPVFWDRYLTRPHAAILSCTKGEDAS
ncbi:class I SAM-dependent methyltransferase [Streptomyces sp. NPDC001840]